MKLIELLAKCIGKVWDFCTRIISISLIVAFVLFVLTVFFPNQILGAVEIVKSLF